MPTLKYRRRERQHHDSESRELLRYFQHEREALTAPPATITKTIGTAKEHIDLLVKLLHVVGHVLWLSTDDSSKRFALIEL